MKAERKIVYKAEYNCTFPGVYRMDFDDALRESELRPGVFIRYFETFRDAKKFLLDVLNSKVHDLKIELERAQDNVRQVKQQYE